MFDDVIDALGVVPRELGPVQIAVEKAERVGSEVRLLFLLQAASTPTDGALILGAKTELLRRALPAMADGSVWRVGLTLTVPEDATLGMAIEFPRRERRRVRESWALDQAAERSRAGGEAANLLASNLLGVASLAFLGIGWVTIPGGGGEPEAPKGPMVEQAQLTVKTVEAFSFAPVEERVWRPGQPVPYASPIVPVVPDATAQAAERAAAAKYRVCRQCDFKNEGSPKRCEACGEWMD